MILGLDHLALSVTDTDAAMKDLEERGYEAQFVEKGVANHPEKRKLLFRYNPLHDLGLFRPGKGGVAVEITNHGPESADGAGPYECLPGAIRLGTPAAEREMEFWAEALRFGGTDDGSVLRFSSPVPGWAAQLRFVEEETARPCFLDSPGFTCLAFLSSGLGRDLERVDERGGREIAGPFGLTVNGKDLRVALFRTPGGAICELIEVVR